jgi:Primase X
MCHLVTALLRIPGSSNSKCVTRNNNISDSSTQVRVIKQWNDKTRAPFYLLIGSFLAYLVAHKLENEEKQLRRQKQFSKYGYTLKTATIPWIEKLLQTPVDNYRKSAVSLILAPYLINIRKLSYDESFNIIMKWLDKCNIIKRRLDFNPRYHSRYNLRYAASKGSRPLKLETLKEKNKELYYILAK